MGFFSTETGPSVLSSGHASLTIERVTESLGRLGWNYQVDDSGRNVLANWETGLFAFSVNGDAGEILGLVGYWRGGLEESDYLRGLETCNDWNRTVALPKAFVVRDEQGLIHLNVEHSVDYEHGVTDEQLDQHLLNTVNCGMVFFVKLVETFPEAWAQATSAG